MLLSTTLKGNYLELFFIEMPRLYSSRKLSMISIELCHVVTHVTYVTCHNGRNRKQLCHSYNKLLIVLTQIICNNEPFIFRRKVQADRSHENHLRLNSVISNFFRPDYCNTKHNAVVIRMAAINKKIESTVLPSDEISWRKE